MTVNFNASSSTGGVTYIWNFGDSGTGSGTSISHTYLMDNVYTVTLTITASTGCTSSVQNTNAITVNPLPDANFSANPNPISSLNPIVNFTDLSTVTISSWLWNFGDINQITSNTSTVKNPIHTYSSAGNYNVQLIVTNQFGCVDTAYKEIILDADIVFPNVFTPNENGGSGGLYNTNSLDNNIFFPYTSGVVEFKIEIFNRWGELIFESDEIKIGWDGYYRGKLCPQDVYVWKAYLKLNSGKTFNKSGDVTLLR